MTCLGLHVRVRDRLRSQVFPIIVPCSFGFCRVQVLENPFFIKHGMRLSTCLQLIEATDEMQQRFEGLGHS